MHTEVAYVEGRETCGGEVCKKRKETCGGRDCVKRRGEVCRGEVYVDT